MKQTLFNQGDQFLKKYKGLRRWQKIVTVLSCIVVFCTTYALILPAITLEKDAYCGYEEHAGHTKEAGCYETVQKITCTLAETDGHKHDDSCYTTSRILVCGLEESETIPATEETEEIPGHTHSESCYEEITTLTCSEAEKEPHHHSKECYSYEDVLTCKKSIHSHTDDCFHGGEDPDDSDETADVETREDWEATLKKVELTGNWDEDVIAVAESQLGYKESKKNYIVNETGRKLGYSRYGAWYGNAYGDWCAMFVSFCLHYAEVDVDMMPHEAGCQRWINQLVEGDEYEYYLRKDYTPKMGDLIFFDWDGYEKEEDRHSDHIGLVRELITDKNGNVKQIKTIEGNSSDKVQYVTYDADDTCIMGYGVLPMNPEKMDEVVEKTYKEKDFSVAISYPRKAMIPDDAEIVAEEYKEKSEEYKALYEKAREQYGWEEDYTDSFRIFYIGLRRYNEEIQPAEEVQIELTLKNKSKEDTSCQLTYFGSEIRPLAITSHVDGKERVISFNAKVLNSVGVFQKEYEEITDSKEEPNVEEKEIPKEETPAEEVPEEEIPTEVVPEEETPAEEVPEEEIPTEVVPEEETPAEEVPEEEIPTEMVPEEETPVDIIPEEPEEDRQEIVNIEEPDSLKEDVTEDLVVPVTKTFEAPGYIVNVTYDKQSAIPDDANLIAIEYKKTSKEYKARYKEASEFHKWGKEKDLTDRFRLFNIGLYVDDEELQPEGEVNVSITLKNEETEVAKDNCQVTHFSDEIEVLEAEAQEEGEDKVIDFTTESFSDFGLLLAAEPGISLLADLEYHSCTSDEIAHVSLDGRDGWMWRENTTDDTGRATYQNRSGSTRNNALANGDANQAPVKPIAGNIYPISAKMVSTERDDLTISGNPKGTPLIKGKGYSEFAFDFWVEPTAKASTDDKDFALFEIGSINNTGNTRNTLTAAMPKNNNNPKQIVLAAPNDKSITIDLSESIINQWVHIYVTYSGSEATLWVENAEGKVLGKGTLNTALTVSGLFDTRSVELIDFGNIKNNAFFNGFIDDIIIYNHALTVPGNETSGGSGHPKTAITENIRATGVGLYNVNTKGGDAEPLAGVEYTVYKSDGSIYGTYTTIDEYVLSLGKIPAGTYTIEQTAVPEGYVLVPQTKTFTVSANADNLTQAGLFYDYYSGDSYNPSKKGEVVDYENRIYDIILSAKSGTYEKIVDPKNFNFVVDQSNSMLFPAVLTDTGAKVTLHSVSDGNASTWQNDASGNTRRLDNAIRQNGLDPNKLYYLKAMEATTSTVYAIWKSADGHWYAQDASNYAQAQAGVNHPSEARNYQYADTFETKWGDGGGCLDGNTRLGGTALSALGDLWNDMQAATQNSSVSYTYNDKTTYDHYKEYKIYSGSEMNRLTYLKYAIKRLVMQLAAMDSKNRVTVTSFDYAIEGCMTREVDQHNPQGVLDLVQFVDGIQTNGGTAQDFGIAHVLGDHADGGNKTSCSGGHLNYTVDGKKADDYIVLITDGALNNKNGNKVYGKGSQEEELFAGANKFKANGQNPKLITIGLSMQDVEWGKSLLANESSGGIATNGYSFPDINADDLAITLSNALIGDLIELEKVDDYANIRDYISDSFYLVDTDGMALAEGDKINLNGHKVATNASDAAGTVGHDSKGWYVEWKNQTLGDGTEATPGSSYTEYTYTDGAGKKTILNTNTIYYIDNWYGNRDISGSGSNDTSKDRLRYVDGSWVFVYKGGYKTGSVGNRVTSRTVTIPGTLASPIWQGKIYVKAKEDFIGGNTIDANKTFVSEDGRKVTEGAQIFLLESQNSDTVRDTIGLATPTVNVRLLPINNVHSEETVFLGDTVENLNTKLENLWDKLEFTKLTSVGEKLIQNNGDAVHNKTNAEGTPGLEVNSFTPAYAIGRSLTKDEWDKLFAGEKLTFDYIYDDASSHGKVGSFKISLTKEIKEGENEGYDNHTSSLTGKEVEKYILTLDYVADLITDGPRNANVNNFGQGPGTEVGGSEAGDKLETGKGTVQSVNTHLVHVIDGEIYLTKIIDNSMISDEDQEFTFYLYQKNSTTGEPIGDPLRTVSVKVKAGETEGTIYIGNLPRNKYIVKEADSDEYTVEGVEIVPNHTTCEAESSKPTLEFDIGTNEESPGDDKNVIIYNSPNPVYEDSMWEEGERYVYSKPFKEVEDVDGPSDPVSEVIITTLSAGHGKVSNRPTTSEVEIPVIKNWASGIPTAEYNDLDVYVALYRGDTPVMETIDGESYVKVLKLNRSNEWQGIFKAPAPADGKTVYEEGYTVREISKVSEEQMDSDQYIEGIVQNVTVGTEDDASHPHIWYMDATSSGVIVIDNKGFTVDVDENNDGFTVTNSPTYSLPESGGIGTNMFTIGGVLLMSISLLYGFILRRKQERRIY